MEEQTQLHDIILGRINDLKADMYEGFSGVHKRQDTTNSRLSKAEITMAYMKGAIAVVVAMVIPMIVWFLNAYLLKK